MGLRGETKKREFGRKQRWKIERVLIGENFNARNVRRNRIKNDEKG